LIFKKKKPRKINYENGKVKRYIQFILGILLVSIAFNIFVLPNDLVYGVSGIAVMLNKTLHITPSITILIGSIFLLILSFTLLGFEKTKNSIIGSILYPIFVELTVPIFKYIDLSDKTKLIQVWHAGVGFKSVGYARFGFAGPEPYDSCHRKYDYAIVGSKALVPVYAEVFGIDKNKILPYGLPRLDNFLD